MNRAVLHGGVLIAFALLGSCGWAHGEADPQTPVAPSPADAVARLLARAEEPPLFTIVLPDLHRLPSRLAQSHLGHFVLDPNYDQGRALLLQKLNEVSGTDLEALWTNLRAHIEGPVALVLSRAAPLNEGDIPGFKLRLLASVPDAASIEAVQAAWPRLPPQSGHLLSLLRPQLYAREALSAEAAPPEWAVRIARAPGLARVQARPRALNAALREWATVLPETERSGWMEAIQATAALEFETLTLDLRTEGGQFEERLELEPLAEGGRTLTRLLRGMAAKPRPWTSLTSALPGRQALALLFQLEPEKLSDELPYLLQALERTVRGRKWMRTQGNSPDARDPERFAFLTTGLSGIVGLTAQPSVTGKVDVVLAAASKDRDVEAHRLRLLKGLEALDANFLTLHQAARIGTHAPLAAQFKGPDLLPAPVIGLSEGWLWLCSTTGAYGVLTQAFASGKTLAQDPPPFPAPREDGSYFARPEASALRMSINLEMLAPLGYTSWLLSKDGPTIGDWKVPGELLPQPGLFANRMGRLETDLWTEDGTVRGYGRGPVPLGAVLTLALVGETGRIVEILQRPPGTVLEELKALTQPAGGAKPEPRP